MSDVRKSRSAVYQGLATLVQACNDAGLRASGSFAIRDDRRGYADWSFDSQGDDWSEALYLVPDNTAELAEFVGQYYGHQTTVGFAHRNRLRGILQPHSDDSFAVVVDGRIVPISFSEVKDITVRITHSA